MQNKVKSFQLSMLIFAIVPVTKFLLMPATAATLTQNNSYIAVFLMLLLDFAVLSLILLTSKKYPHFTLEETLTRSMGKCAAKIVLWLYSVYFLIRSISPIFELRRLLSATLYDALPGVIAVLPLLFFSVFAMVKGLRALGRSANIIGFVSVISILLILFLSLGDVGFDRLLPFVASDIPDCFSALPNLAIWFGDAAVFLVFIGKTDYKNGKIKQILLSFLFSCLIVLAFVIILTAVYGNITARQTNALVKISRFATSLTKLGRFDWIPILLLLTCQIFASAVAAVCCFSCVKSALNTEKHPLIIALSIAAAQLILLLFVGDDINFLYGFYSRFFSYAAIGFQYLLPLLLPVLNFIAAHRSFKC